MTPKPATRTHDAAHPTTDPMSGAGTIGCLPAESAFLGSLLQLPNRQVAHWLRQVRPVDLVDPRHRVVLTALQQLVSCDAPVDPDPVVVLGQLRRTGADLSFLDDRTAGVLLVDLVRSTPVVASVGLYAAIVREHAWRRRIEEAGMRLQQMAAVTPSEDLAQAVLAELKAAVGEVQERTSVMVQS